MITHMDMDMDMDMDMVQPPTTRDYSRRCTHPKPVGLQ